MDVATTCVDARENPVLSHSQSNMQTQLEGIIGCDVRSDIAYGSIPGIIYVNHHALPFSLARNKNCLSSMLCCQTMHGVCHQTLDEHLSRVTMNDQINVYKSLTLFWTLTKKLLYLDVCGDLQQPDSPPDWASFWPCPFLRKASPSLCPWPLPSIGFSSIAIAGLRKLTEITTSYQFVKVRKTL